MWNIFKQNNRTIFFTTHIWEEAEKYADEIAFIDDGKIKSFDSVEALLSEKYIKSSKKVVIRNMNNDVQSLINREVFFEHDNQFFIFPDNLDEFVSKLNNSKYPYSILPKELKDVFLFL